MVKGHSGFNCLFSLNFIISRRETFGCLLFVTPKFPKPSFPPPLLSFLRKSSYFSTLGVLLLRVPRFFSLLSRTPFREVRLFALHVWLPTPPRGLPWRKPRGLRRSAYSPVRGCSLVARPCHRRAPFLPPPRPSPVPPGLPPRPARPSRGVPCECAGEKGVRKLRDRPLAPPRRHSRVS